MTNKDLELIRDYLDERISPEDLLKLDALLENDAEARAQFRALSTMEEGLRDLAIAGADIIPFADVAEDAKSSDPSSLNRFFPIAIAAMFAACLGLTGLLFQQRDANTANDDSVARLEFVSKDAAFQPDHQLPTEAGSRLGKGWVQLEQGSIRIVFHSGASVELEGPAAFGLDSPMRSYLEFGRASVFAPESARDFTIATEGMEVVDLGTRFELMRDPESGESNVEVTEGLVDLHLGSRGTARTIRPLEAGFAARVDGSGEIVEISKRNPIGVKPSPEILAHWTFDQLGENGAVADSSGHQLNGIHNAREPAPLVAGVNGQALQFSGQDSVDLREHVAALGRLDAFTFAVWVRDPQFPMAMLFSFSGDTERQRIQLFLARRFVRFGWQDGLHFDSMNGRVDGWEPDRWYHVAVTVEGGVARLCRDGRLLGSGSVGTKIGTPVSNPSLVKNASHAYFGRLQDGSQGGGADHQWYEGQMDDVQIYRGALDREAVRFLFEQPGQVWKSPSVPTQVNAKR